MILRWRSRVSAVQVDLIPVTFSERLMEQDDLTPGSHIGVLGQFRSYNKMSGEKSRLMLTVFAREFVDYDDGSRKAIISK